jgi:hypothetical protein
MTACGNKMSGICGGCVYFNRCRNSEIEKLPKTNIEWMRTASDKELAGAIYEWYSQGHIEGKHEKPLSSVTRVVEWLKQPHQKE